MAARVKRVWERRRSVAASIAVAIYRCGKKEASRVIGQQAFVRSFMRKSSMPPLIGGVRERWKLLAIITSGEGKKKKKKKKEIGPGHSQNSSISRLRMRVSAISETRFNDRSTREKTRVCRHFFSFVMKKILSLHTSVWFYSIFLNCQEKKRKRKNWKIIRSAKGWKFPSSLILL